MKLIRHFLSRNWLAWREGNYTLKIIFRGTKEELMQKLKNELSEDLGLA